MKKEIKSNLTKYRKEVLVFLIGSSLMAVILLNLSTPQLKREIASQKDLPQVTNPDNDTINETVHAAKKVEEEQEQQSVMISDFKKNYAKLLKTKSCLKTQDCDFPDSDPREYNLSVLKEVSLQLETLRPQLISNWFRLNYKVKDAVISSIKLDDGFVKEEVLELLNSLTLDESNEYLPLVLDEVIDHHNSELVPEAFKFIKKTATPKNEIQTAKRIAKAIVSGAPHASQAMSKDVSMLISPNTAEIYKEALSSLPKQAPETEYLTSALSEFELRKSGG